MYPSESAKVLLVDDDREIRGLLVDRLSAYGFEAVAVDSGAAMAEELGKGEYDLVVLDIMLKGENGLDLCKEVRSSRCGFKRIPILFLSALGETSDRIVGLEIGADDYLPKPFETRELVARIKAILRRSEGRPSSEDVQDASPALPFLRFGEWRLNIAARHLIDPSGLVLPLSAAEYRLLTFFLEHPQQVLTREQLVEHIAARSPDIYDRSLDAQISRLRAKLKDNARNPEVILTMRGDGYMLATPVSREAGLTVNEIKEVLVHTYAYAGFPRALNGINAFIAVMDEREKQGIKDVVGPEAGVIATDKSKYEYGHDTLARLRDPSFQPGPAGSLTIPAQRPRYETFAPAIEVFLKEHLFADIFIRDVLDYRSREIATVGVLFNLPGTNAQLRSHTDLAMRQGFSEQQMRDLFTVMGSCLGRERGGNALMVLRQVVDARNE